MSSLVEEGVFSNGVIKSPFVINLSLSKTTYAVKKKMFRIQCQVVYGHLPLAVNNLSKFVLFLFSTAANHTSGEY